MSNKMYKICRRYAECPKLRRRDGELPGGGGDLDVKYLLLLLLVPAILSF